MPLLGRLKRDTYRDSVELMRLSAEVEARPGMRQFSAMMATPANIQLLRASNLICDELDAARPSDLLLAAEADDPATAEAALAAAEAFLMGGRAREPSAKPGRSAEPRPQLRTGEGGDKGEIVVALSLRGALAARPGLNLALISVPGDYAAAEAQRWLRAGLHVMLFSDNVPLEQEIALKAEADRMGLLCMGPDCGTALIGGVPLGFANVVRRGRIGLVGASGTGLQAVTCQIHQLGEGVSHALGSGGRDLSNAVGGRTTLAALKALADDPSTEVLVVLSKPGDPTVEAKVVAAAAKSGKPAVLHFLGRSEPPTGLPPGCAWAADLDQTARVAVALARGEAVEEIDHPVEAEVRALASAAGPGALAGLFVGGTLAVEAARLLGQRLESGKTVAASAGETGRVGKHAIVDLGDDAFTRGKPHPMIDPSIRAEAIERAVADGASLLLVDVVLGHGAHPDPAGMLAQAIQAGRQQAARRGRRLEAVASVVGTDHDPQPLDAQIGRLQAAGVRVYQTPTLAARVAVDAAALIDESLD